MMVIETETPAVPRCSCRPERPLPVVGPREVLIKVAAAASTAPMCCSGSASIRRRPAHPIFLVSKSRALSPAGAGGTQWRRGDRCARSSRAEATRSSARRRPPQCLPVPRGMVVDAAGIPETFFTVWTNVFERGRLRRRVAAGPRRIERDRHDRDSARERARRSGVRNRGSARKCAACEALGAETAVNYHEADFVEVVRERTSGRGVDVILDMVGGDYFPSQHRRACRRRAARSDRHAGAGSKSEIFLQTIMQRRLTVTGSTLRARPVAAKGAIAAALHAEVWPLLESGAVRPVVFRTSRCAKPPRRIA